MAKPKRKSQPLKFRFNHVTLFVASIKESQPGRDLIGEIAVDGAVWKSLIEYV